MPRKNPDAVRLGRRGGLKGGRVRAERLSSEERRESARNAVLARWARHTSKGNSRYPESLKTNEFAEVEPERRFSLFRADCFEWLARRESDSIHAVVTDPPYGLVEFTEVEKSKLRSGRGGVWRIPPSFDGNTRNPVPRFTVLRESDLEHLVKYFAHWAVLIKRVLVPGAHIFLASNPLLSDLVSNALRTAGLEKRGEIIRLVQTLRGGDRPKNAHTLYSDVTVMPRSCYEPWLLFRKPCISTVQDSLRRFGTGGLRRTSDAQPFRDVILSSPTRPEERAISNHPALKPQTFVRQVVKAALPLGQGIILDPFMGGGSTIAAAQSCGYQSIGVENDETYFRIAEKAIPHLAALRGGASAIQLPL